MKKEIHQKCLQVLKERIDSLKEALAIAQEAANEETKSSAGDKHETGRAMMQLETEKLHEQLGKALRENDHLQRIDPGQKCESVKEGALVETNRMVFYFAVSAGNHKMEGKDLVSLSIGSPLGMAASGKKKGDTFRMRDITYTILKII